MSKDEYVKGRLYQRMNMSKDGYIKGRNTPPTVKSNHSETRKQDTGAEKEKVKVKYMNEINEGINIFEENNPEPIVCAKINPKNEHRIEGPIALIRGGAEFKCKEC